jgi:RAP domain
MIFFVITRIVLDDQTSVVMAIVQSTSGRHVINGIQISTRSSCITRQQRSTTTLLQLSSSSSSLSSEKQQSANEDPIHKPSSSTSSKEVVVDSLPTIEDIQELIAQLDDETSSSAAAAAAAAAIAQLKPKSNKKQKHGNSTMSATTAITATRRPRKQQQQPKQQQQGRRSSSQSSSSSSSSSSNMYTTPWKAGYHTSKKTQEKIQQTYEAVTRNNNMKQEKVALKATQRSKRVLDTLMTTPSYLCNPTNIVGALTYSVKAMGHAYIQNPDPSLRQSLYEVFDILHELLVVGGGSSSSDDHDDRNGRQQPQQQQRRRRNRDRILQPRQLCNVIWAIAKHVDRDPELLLPSSSTTSNAAAASADPSLSGIRSSLKRKSLDEDRDVDDNIATIKKQQRKNYNKRDSPEGRLDETIDEIARQLTELLREEQFFRQQQEQEGKEEGEARATSRSKNEAPSRSPLHLRSTSSMSKKNSIKTGEICMACWAYGKLRPRVIPPGRAERPQMGRINLSTDGQTNIRVERREWGSSRRSKLLDTSAQNDKHDDVEENQDSTKFYPKDITDELLDAVGTALSEEISDDELAADSYKSVKLRLDECRWSELANVGWAFASHGSCRSAESETLLNNLASVTTRRLTEESTVANNNNNNSKMLVRDVAQVLWSLGTLQADNFRIAEGMLDVVDALSYNLQLGSKKGTSFTKGRPLCHWCCADLVQVAVALAHARIDETLLLQSIYEEGIYRLMEGSSEPSISSFGDVSDGRRTFHPWEVSIMLWAQARLSLTVSQGLMFDEFATDAPRYFLHTLRENNGSFKMARIGPQEQANIAWSLVVLEKFYSPDAMELLNSIFVDAARICKEEGAIQLDHANQLWQAYFILQDECPMAVAEIPDWFVDYLNDKWTQEKARDKLSSARHRQLSSTLQLMGIDHINESDEDIDVAIILKPNANWVHQTAARDQDDDDHTSSTSTTNKLMLAVEFDGPNHFTRVEHLYKRGNSGPVDPPRALGHTVLKYRQLKKQGWTVVRVPYYEFDRIPFWASMERQRYLQRKLKTSASIEFSAVDVSEYKALTPNRIESRFD